MAAGRAPRRARRATRGEAVNLGTTQPRRSRRSRSTGAANVLRFRLFRVAVACVSLLGVSAGAQAPPDRSAPPVLGPAPKLSLPPIVKRTLSNGLPVWLIETHEVPLVQVDLLIQ